MVKRWSLPCACLSLLGACGPVITRSGYPPGSNSHAGQDCTVTFLTLEQARALESPVLGSVDVYDGGVSLRCDEAEVRAILRREACVVGANVVAIDEERRPSIASSCYQARARLLHLDEYQASGSERAAVADDDAVQERARTSTRRQRAGLAGIYGGLGAVCLVAVLVVLL